MANMKFNKRRSVFYFALVVTAFEILTFQDFTLKSRSRSRSTTFAIVYFDGKYQNLNKSFHVFCNSSHSYEDINVSMFDLEKVGHSHKVQVGNGGL